ncbi:hypothetical protein MPER_09838 [Moniliophthora perniciosa FA553]|nr:hypothetical protein MPER_09838 [Moniliophthora perniciosa FA553]
MDQLPPPDVLKPIATAVVGPIFIGNMLNWLLMGTLLVQVYHYYTTFHNDKRFLRTLVYGLFFIDFAQTLMCTQFAWHYAVDIWNEPLELNGIIPWTAGVIPIVGGFVSMCVQFFYAW